MPDETQEKASSGDTYNQSGDFRGAMVNIKSNITTTIVRQRTCPTPPPAPDHFGGRDKPLTDLKLRLKEGKFTAITAMHGLGGIGKTTLARQLANDLFYDDKTFRAVLWADITREPNPLSLLTSWANYADPAFVPGDKPIQQVALQVKALLEGVIGEECKTCTSKRVLVVLDDVWESGKEAVRLLRLACPVGATLLLTTRNEGLGYDLGANMTSLDRLSKEEGIEFLREYLPEAETKLLGKLSEVLGGHPLALSLAARRVQKKKVNRARALAEQLAEYERKLPALTQFNSLQLDQGQSREDNLSLVLSYSYAELEEAEQARFRALGVLAYDQPFDLGLLGAIWKVSSEGEESENRALIEGYCEGLCLRGLLEVHEGVSNEDGNSWYRLHPLLQAYARALLLQDAAEYGEVLCCYQQQVIKIAYQFVKGQLPPEEWGQLNPYLPHILAVGDGLVDQTAALETIEDEGLISLAQSFALNTCRYLRMRREMRRDKWLEMGLASSRKLQDEKREALFLNELALLYKSIGEMGKALEYYEQALPINRALGDRGGEATTLNNMGKVYSDLGEKEKALEYYEQALPIHRAVGDRNMEATTLNNIGMVYSDLGEKEKALEYYEQALPLRRAVGNRGGEASTLNNMGKVYSDLGEKEKALEYYEQALPINRALGDRGGEATTLNNMGKVYSDLGEKEKALEYYEQALPLRRAVGDRGGEATTLNNMGILLWEMGQPHEGMAMVEQALALWIAIRSPNAEIVKDTLREMKDELGQS